MDQSILYLRENYLSPVDFRISTYIYEYDIAKANLNVLYDAGYISEAKYSEYYFMDGYTRKVALGYLQKDKTISKALKDGLTEARRWFIQLNGFTDEDIHCIKKDAIYIINKVPTVTKVGNVEFVMKNQFTSYYYISNLLKFYYYYNMVTGEEKLGIDGIDDKIHYLHEMYILEFLKFLFETAQTSSIEETINVLVAFYNAYLNRTLDPGYYRELNSLSEFRLPPTKFTSFMFDFVDTSVPQYLELGCNRDILRQLYRYYSSIYLSKQSQNSIKGR